VVLDLKDNKIEDATLTSKDMIIENNCLSATVSKFDLE
jgi:hypothetical protein